MANHFHGLEMNMSVQNAWLIQELIHDAKPERIVILGDDTPGLSAWLCDCMHRELIHPFVIEVSDIPQPRGMSEYEGIVWMDGPLDIATFNRITPLVGCPTMLIVNRRLSEGQRKLYYSLVTVGQFLIEMCFGECISPSMELSKNNLSERLMNSPNLHAFKKSLPIS